MTVRKLSVVTCDGTDPAPDGDVLRPVRCIETYAWPLGPLGRGDLLRAARADGWYCGDWDFCPKHHPKPNEPVVSEFWPEEVSTPATVTSVEPSRHEGS